MQISNGISYDVAFFIHARCRDHAARSVAFVGVARRGTGNAELSLFSRQKEIVYVAEAPRDFTLRNAYISPGLLSARSCLLETSPRKCPWKYSPIRDYTVATS